jgi:flagellar biosynthetic protein FlhB
MADEASNAEDRSEPASARKKEESRKKGQVVKSVEMNSALALLAGLMILYIGGGVAAQQLASAAKSVFINAGRVEVSQTMVQNEMSKGLSLIGYIVAPVALGLLIVGLMANIAEVGFLFSFEALEPKWGRLNPLKGISNLFMSRRSAVELTKSLAKILVVGIVCYFSLDSFLSDSVSLADADVQALSGFFASGAFSLGFKAAAAMLVLAVIDYGFQRFEHERSLRMTKQEVKDEYKMMEGDPAIKGKIKTIQRQIAYKRMMSDVPKADVVITNPTHLAMALKYDSSKMSAPKVVAKGADLIALKIREIAKQHSVPIVEDKPLAQALYKSVDVGDDIPEKLFQAVAQVLAYIFRLRDSKTMYAAR